MSKFVQRFLSDQTALTLVLANLVLIAISRAGVPGTAQIGFLAFIVNLPARIAAFAYDNFEPRIPFLQEFGALDPGKYPMPVLVFVVVQWLLIGNAVSYIAGRIDRTQSRL